VDTFQSNDPDLKAALEQLQNPKLFLQNPIFKMLLRVTPEEFVERMNMIFSNMVIISGLMLGGATIAAENPSTGYRFGAKAARWTWIYFFNTYVATAMYIVVALLAMSIRSSYNFAFWMTVSVAIFFFLHIAYFSQLLAVLSPLMFSG
jgi:hypothetical protein